jgi:hypothetical protein
VGGPKEDERRQRFVDALAVDPKLIVKQPNERFGAANSTGIKWAWEAGVSRRAQAQGD